MSELTASPTTGPSPSDLVVGNGLAGHRSVEAAAERARLLSYGPVVVGEKARRAHDRQHLRPVSHAASEDQLVPGDADLRATDGGARRFDLRSQRVDRSVVGDPGGRPTVGSPIFGQRFDQGSGRCRLDEVNAVAAHELGRAAGVVHVPSRPRRG